MKLFAHIKLTDWDYGDCEFVEIANDSDEEIIRVVEDFTQASEITIVRMEKVREFNIQAHRERLERIREEKAAAKRAAKQEKKDREKYEELKKRFEPSEY